MAGKKMEINTAQNVGIIYPLASVGERILAVIIDSVILYLFLYFVAQSFIDDYGRNAEYVFTLFIIPVWLFYALVSEALSGGQSFGKRALGIKVVRLDGRQAQIGDFLMRWFFRCIDVLFSFGTIAALLVSSGSRAQRLGDIVANTTVIKARVNYPIRIADLARRMKEPELIEYPSIRQFSESEMLTVKYAVDRYRKYPNQGHKEAIQVLVEKMTNALDVAKAPEDEVSFLLQLVREYVFITRNN